MGIKYYTLDDYPNYIPKETFLDPYLLRELYRRCGFVVEERRVDDEEEPVVLIVHSSEINIDVAQVYAMREETGCGLQECTRALRVMANNYDNAKEWLRWKG